MKKIVPTYHLRKSDIIRDEKIQAGWKKDFQDSSSNLPETFLNRGVADAEVDRPDMEEEEKGKENRYQVYMIDDLKKQEGKRRMQAGKNSLS